MIDKSKFQIEILKNLLSKHPYCLRVDVSKTEVAICDGYCFVVFLRDELKLDVDKIPAFKYDLSDANKCHPVLTDSMVRKNSGGRVVARLENTEWGVKSYVQEKYIRLFSGCTLSSDGDDSVVYAKDGAGNLIGLFMPMRTSEKEAF